MREIKCRAWDVLNSRMTIPDGLDLVNRLCLDAKKGWHNTSPYEGILMLFIGLKDRCGNDIYDSDLVEFYYKGENVICEIVFHNGCFKLKWRDGYINNHELNPGRYKVVGNIYENPELLNPES